MQCKIVNIKLLHTFNGPLSGTTQVSRYPKGKTNLDFTEAIDSEWQWHQLGHMQVCTSLQTDNHASTPPPSFLQAGCPSCHWTNSVKALKAHTHIQNPHEIAPCHGLSQHHLNQHYLRSLSPNSMPIGSDIFAPWTRVPSIHRYTATSRYS